MAKLTCTNYSTNENGDVVGMCHERAVVIYSRPNEEQGPNKPKVIDFPRCAIHDNTTIRAAAAEQGYTREVL